MNATSSHLILSSLGGAIRETSHGVFDCRYPGRFVTFMLCIPATLAVVGALALLVAGVAGGHTLRALSTAAPCLPAALIFCGLVRFRLRRMGHFVVDRNAGELVRMRGRHAVARWPLSSITFRRAWDPFHRGFSFQYWLAAKVPDGRSLRLGKGTRNAVDGALAKLAGEG